MHAEMKLCCGTTINHEQTQPLIDYYNKLGILKSVDGTRPMETVFAEIVRILEA